MLLPILLLRLIRMTFFAFRLSALIALLFAFSSADALHGQTLGGPWTKHHLRLRADKKQVVLDSSPEYSTFTQPSKVPTSTTSSFNLSDAQQTGIATGGSDVVVSPQDSDTDGHVPHAPVSFHEQDACSGASSKILVMGYYPDWAYPAFPPENIDFRRYDWIDFAFALPDADFALVWDDMDNGPKLLERLVTAAHAEGSKVKLSIGGWTGSQ
jgi:hypothetical protein